MTYQLELSAVDYDLKSKEAFFNWLYTEFQEGELLGVCEGSVLATDWALDDAQAPSDRDWPLESKNLQSILYFDSKQTAINARTLIEAKFKDITCLAPKPLEQKDWNQAWKSHFKTLSIDPWTIVPSWEKAQSHQYTFQIHPGAGFGTGSHETTHLCLQKLGQFQTLQNQRVLDFGSGSGILSIAAAKLGAKVTGIEIDELAIDNAIENVKLNHLENQIQFKTQLQDNHLQYDLVIANILKNVLLSVAPKLCGSLKKNAPLILSGLLEQDLKPVLECYQKLLGDHYRSEVVSLHEWKMIYFCG